MKKRERIERLEDEIYHGGSDPIRDGILTRLEKLEGSVGEELPRLFTRIEELERVRVELEAALIRVEGDKARQPETQGDFVQGTGWNKDKARQPERYWFEGEWWVKSYHSGVVGPGEVVLAHKDGRPFRWPKDGGGQSMRGWTHLRREGADRRFDDPAVARQPDEPMADMPETCPDCDDEYPGECATCKPETGPSYQPTYEQARIDAAYNYSAAYKQAIAERDQARAERNQLREEVRLLKSERDEARTARDGVEQYWDRKYAATRDMCAEYRAELDRLREGIEGLARQYDKWGAENVAHNLRALLDGGDDE